MKVVDITILRTDSNQDPIPLSSASDLSSYGYFQRQVSSFVVLFPEVKLFWSVKSVIQIGDCITSD